MAKMTKELYEKLSMAGKHFVNIAKTMNAHAAR